MPFISLEGYLFRTRKKILFNLKSLTIAWLSNLWLERQIVQDIRGVNAFARTRTFIFQVAFSLDLPINHEVRQ